ncbi:TetR/AcrR family transcriptional regulator [Sphingomonas sp. HF-S3]|uniref:TetR/AcrR family transcriptional regulator n=1 Tax=Sphingomonas rustica TaxID=3103142 RepID=A0ABV0B8S2_9SPHN
MTYHHGDARAALIAAAGEWLEEVGAAGLSLRGVAERAGLSRQAPYNHFADKEAMLAVLAAQGFERLAAAVRAASGWRAGVAALAAAGEAYIGFAQARPALFRLMFARELVDIARFPEAAAAAGDALAALTQVVAGLCPAARVADVSLAAWSIVHGYATLTNEAGIEPPARRTARARQFAEIVAASARTAADGTNTRSREHGA